MSCFLWHVSKEPRNMKEPGNMTDFGEFFVLNVCLIWPLFFFSPRKSLTPSWCQISLLTRWFVWQRCSSAKCCQLNLKDQHTHTHTFHQKDLHFTKTRRRTLQEELETCQQTKATGALSFQKSGEWRPEIFKQKVFNAGERSSADAVGARSFGYLKQKYGYLTL